MKQLKTEYLGLSLRNPLIVSSSGLTASLEKLQRLEAARSGSGRAQIGLRRTDCQ